MVEFILAVFFLLITPGPGVLSTAGVGAAYGYKLGLAYVGGLFVGNNLVSILVISGIATIVLDLPWLRFLLLTFSTVTCCFWLGVSPVREVGSDSSHLKNVWGFGMA